MFDKQIIKAIKNKKWIMIQYNDEKEPTITIKPIFTGDSSYGDYFVYAWAWHSGQPGYYRFDFDKIHGVSAMMDFDDPIEKEYTFVYPTWMSMLDEYRDDYINLNLPDNK